MTHDELMKLKNKDLNSKFDGNKNKEKEINLNLNSDKK